MYIVFSQECNVYKPNRKILYSKKYYSNILGNTKIYEPNSPKYYIMINGCMFWLIIFLTSSIWIFLHVFYGQRFTIIDKKTYIYKYDIF